jgi:rfaE bifunctional protein nucleotidyltransferase chain/domain
MQHGFNMKNIMSPGAYFKERYIRSLQAAAEIVRHCQQGGMKVVFTQGVFDLIHIGHAKYLDEAKKLGDILIVGVDSDELTRHRKPGLNRPVVPEDERLEMLSFMRSIDFMFMRTLPEVQAANDIDYAIKVIRPDIFVMSQTTKDFPPEKKTMLEEYAPDVQILEPQAETSSSARIRFLAMDGASELKKRLDVTLTEFFADAGT